MYKKQEKPDEDVYVVKGGHYKPLVTLKDEHGGVSHIVKDDGCYVLVNLIGDESGLGGVVKTYYWYHAAALALADLMFLAGE